MERANYEFWNTVEEISIPQAAYIWCGYEMPPDETETVEGLEPKWIIVERFERSLGNRLKGKSIPESIKYVLFQLIQAAISGQLLLKDGRKLEAEKINPWLIPETPSSIGPETPNLFRKAITTKKRLREYAKSIEQQPKFLFPDTHQKTVLPDSPRDKIIQSVISGVDKIYDAVKAQGFSGLDSTPFDVKRRNYREAALKELSKIENKCSLIKREYLDLEMFDFQDQQQRRDFIGKLLRKILVDQDIKKPGTYAEIYIRYNYLKKLSGDMSENLKKTE